MDRRQNNGRRRQIVQEFVKGVTDDAERLVCFLYLNGYKDGAVRRTLHIGKPKLELMKLKLALDMKKAGIQPGV